MFRKNILASFSGRFIQVILSILSVPIYINLLGAEGYGLIGFFISCQALFFLFDLGIGGTLARELAQDSSDAKNKYKHAETLKTLEILYIVLSLFAALITFGWVYFFGDRWFQPIEISQEQIINCLYLMVIALTLQLPIGLYNSGLTGLQQLVFLNITNVFFAILRITGGIALLWAFSSNLYVFFIWQIISNFFQVFFLRYKLWYFLAVNTKHAFSWGTILRLWRYAASLSTSSIIVVLLGQIDKILLSALLPLNFFGYYMIANTLAQSLTLLAAPIGDVMFPKYTQLYAKGNLSEFKELYIKTFEVLMVIILPVAGILFFYSDLILNIWIGQGIDLHKTSMIASILILGILLNVAISTLDSVQMAMGSIKSSLIVRGTALFISVPVFYCSVHFFGIYGAPLGWIIIYTFYFIWLPNLVLQNFLSSIQFKWYKVFFKYVVISTLIPALFFWTIQLDLIENITLKFLMVFFFGIITLSVSAVSSVTVRTLVKEIIPTIYPYFKKP